MHDEYLKSLVNTGLIITKNEHISLIYLNNDGKFVAMTAKYDKLIHL